MDDELENEKAENQFQVNGSDASNGPEEEADHDSNAGTVSGNWDAVMRHLGRVLREGGLEAYLGRRSSSAPDDPC